MSMNNKTPLLAYMPLDSQLAGFSTPFTWLQLFAGNSFINSKIWLPKRFQDAVGNLLYAPMFSANWWVRRFGNKYEDGTNIPPAKADAALVFLVIWLEEYGYPQYFSLVGTPGDAYDNYAYPFILAWVDSNYSNDGSLSQSGGFVLQA